MNVATANGTGSQTSNIALFRAMFRMGVPVSGKNLFPSNIQGLPTWYCLRMNRDGHVGFREEHEILVAMNKATVQEDVTKVLPGGLIFYDQALRIEESRDDITYYGMPVKDLVRQVEVPPALRGYIGNMVYVGVLIEMLGIEREEIERALHTHFKGKRKAIDLNMSVVDIASHYAREHYKPQHNYRIRRMEGNEGLLLVDGNTAAALGSIYGGVSVAAWYPITPSTSVIDGLNEYLPQLRMDPETGKATYVVIQAEDELAAIGMVVGAGWAGARAMTATSGPGLSLMAEFAGLAYQAEIPAVIWDIQRVGPSTGLPTRTSQGDLQFSYHLGHGDTQHIVLLPGTPDECFEMGHRALDLAEQFQTLVLVLSDLDLGMNLSMSKDFVYPEARLQRGKVLDAEQLHTLKGHWARYADVDQDGIPYRTLPGTDHPLAGYFTRGTGHNDKAGYSERPEDWENNLQRLQRKFEQARQAIPEPILYERSTAKVGILSFGSNDASIHEALEMLEQKGIVCSYMRLRALPLHEEVQSFLDTYEQIYVVENNHDGQLHKIIAAEHPSYAAQLVSIARLNGLPLQATWITQNIADAYRCGTIAREV
ncbi:MAG: 2-oxoacid:acceptor oxidoreductase subunit alpha [Myxococcota bacterium]